jgi:hypothetical protein
MIQDHKRHRPKETAPARGGAGAVVVGVTYAEGGRHVSLSMRRQ